MSGRRPDAAGRYRPTKKELADRAERTLRTDISRDLTPIVRSWFAAEIGGELRATLAEPKGKAKTRLAIIMRDLGRRVLEEMPGISKTELAAYDHLTDRGDGLRSVRRGFALRAVDLHVRAGVGVKEACRLVARRLKGCAGFSYGEGKSVSAPTLDNWRSSEVSGEHPLLTVGRRSAKVPGLDEMSPAEQAEAILELLRDPNFGAAFDPRKREDWMAPFRGAKRVAKFAKIK